MRIILFAKAPVAGMVKTRLIPSLGAAAAAALAHRLLQHAAQQALQAQPAVVELCASPARQAPEWNGVDLPSALKWSCQGEGDLGARMARAVQRALADDQSVLLMGSDCHDLTAERIRAAATLLGSHDAVMIPAVDGGYVLLGLKRHDPSLFTQVPWSTSSVAAITRQRMRALGWTWAELAPLQDIDEACDLQCLPAAWSW
jgi:rSAM/selenodomain-associated transferase 1